MESTRFHKKKPVTTKATGFEYYTLNVQPARLFFMASAAAAAFFGAFHGFVHSLTGFITGLVYSFFGFISGGINGLLFGLTYHTFSFFLHSVADAFHFAITACGCFNCLFSATCTGFLASTAAGSMCSGNGDTTGTDQAGYAQTGKEFFHVLTYHWESSLKKG
jgi:hypothetical protein